MKDSAEGTTKQEVMMGGLAGVCSGYLFKKVSKYAAATAIVGYVVIQGASQAGYIKINWKKVNDKIEDVKEELEKRSQIPFSELTGELSEIVEDIETLVIEDEGRIKATARRAYEACKQNMATSGSFTGGFILGILFA